MILPNTQDTTKIYGVLICCPTEMFPFRTSGNGRICILRAPWKERVTNGNCRICYIPGKILLKITQETAAFRPVKALAWRALNGMKSVWNSKLSRSIKVSFYQATVGSVLLYGCESWTLKETLRKSLDGCYTRMLPVMLNINWNEHVTK